MAPAISFLYYGETDVIKVEEMSISAYSMNCFTFQKLLWVVDVLLDSTLRIKFKAGQISEFCTKIAHFSFKI